MLKELEEFAFRGIPDVPNNLLLESRSVTPISPVLCDQSVSRSIENDFPANSQCNQVFYSIFLTIFLLLCSITVSVLLTHTVCACIFVYYPPLHYIFDNFLIMFLLFLFIALYLALHVFVFILYFILYVTFLYFLFSFYILCSSVCNKTLPYIFLSIHLLYFIIHTSLTLCSTYG